MATHQDDELLSLAKITEKRAAKFFINGLRQDVYGDLIDDLKTGVAMKTTSYPVGIDKAYYMVTEWAQARSINVSKKSKIHNQSVLAESTEINMATSKNDTVKPGRGNQGKENNPPLSEKKDKQIKLDCAFCRGVQHRFDVCPKAKLIRGLDKLGISTADQIQVKPKAASKQPTVNMYTLANSSESDEFEIACMTIKEAESEDNLPDLVEDFSDDESELEINLLVSDKISIMEKTEKANLASMLRSGPYAGLDNM